MVLITTQRSKTPKEGQRLQKNADKILAGFKKDKSSKKKKPQ